jgi:hypothetical protein
MSWIFVNTGQCGNQVGHEVIDGLWEHTHATGECDLYFQELSNGKLLARSVNLDTEEKVVNACFDRTRGAAWGYDRKSIAHEYGGAGNNWAMGHSCSDIFLRKSLDAVRIQIERCDTPANLLISHSVGGGTGSGLGTKLTESLHDEFNDATRVNFAITPYHFGEVIVQHYNTILCLSKIAACTDAVMLFENETAHHICKAMKMINTPTLYDINQAIAANIIPALLSKSEMTGVNADCAGAISPPRLAGGSVGSSRAAVKGSKSALYNANQHTRSGNAIRAGKSSMAAVGAGGLNNMWSLSRSRSFASDITDLCGHPDYKFVSIYNAPLSSSSSVDFTFDSWMAIMNSVGRNQLQLQQLSSTVGVSSGTVSAGSRADTQVFSTPEKAADDGTPRASPVSSAPMRRPRSLKSILVFRGLDPQTAVQDIANQYHTQRGSFHHHQRQVGGSKAAHVGVAKELNREILSKILGEYCEYSPLFSASSVPIVCGSYHLANRYQRSACLITNNTACVPILQRSLTKSLELYQANAYMHHYFDYGLEVADFTEALQSVAQTVQNYSSL